MIQPFTEWMVDSWIEERKSENEKIKMYIPRTSLQNTILSEHHWGKGNGPIL